MILCKFINWIKDKIQKVGEILSIIYATLIVSGKKTFSQVPEKIKDQVRQVLIDLDLEFLTEE